MPLELSPTLPSNKKPKALKITPKYPLLHKLEHIKPIRNTHHKFLVLSSKKKGLQISLRIACPAGACVFQWPLQYLQLGLREVCVRPSMEAGELQWSEKITAC
jgi:hypothetical protein